MYTSCNLVLLLGLYWVTACFIFVCQLNTSWDPYGNKYHCYYSTSGYRDRLMGDGNSRSVFL